MTAPKKAPAKKAEAAPEVAEASPGSPGLPLVSTYDQLKTASAEAAETPKKKG